MTTWHFDESVARSVGERFEAWTACNANGDVDALGQYLHPQFVYISVFGKRYNRDEYLDLVASLRPGSTYELLTIRARTKGDLALVDGSYLVKAYSNHGADLSAHTCFSAVWTNEDGPWRALSHHGTEMNGRP